MPVAPSDEMRAHVRSTMPELPSARRTRYVDEWGINDEDARVLVGVPGLGAYAEKAVAGLNGGGTAKDVVNWVRQDVLAYLNESGGSPAELTPEMLAELVGLVAGGTISRSQAKDVLDESLRDERWPRDIVETRGLAQVSDERALTEAIEGVLAANPGFVEEYRAADDKSRKKKRGFIIGEAKRLVDGANMQLLNKLLDERL